MGCFHFHHILHEDEESIAKMYKKRVLLIGLDNSGKTSILTFIKTKIFSQSEPTLGLNIETIIIKNFEFLIFDVGGKVRSLWSHYYENLSAVVFVIDSCDKARFWESKQELMKLNDDLKYKNVPLLIFYNKQDLNDAVEFFELIESTGIKDILDLDVITQKCSAKTGEGLNEGFEKLIGFFIVNEKNGNIPGKTNWTFSNLSSAPP